MLGRTPFIETSVTHMLTQMGIMQTCQLTSRHCLWDVGGIFYLFLERGREGEREGEKHPCVVASCAPPTGHLAHNPGMGPDWELNW